MEASPSLSRQGTIKTMTRRQGTRRHCRRPEAIRPVCHRQRRLWSRSLLCRWYRSSGHAPSPGARAAGARAAVARAAVARAAVRCRAWSQQRRARRRTSAATSTDAPPRCGCASVASPLRSRCPPGWWRGSSCMAIALWDPRTRRRLRGTRRRGRQGRACRARADCPLQYPPRPAARSHEARRPAARRPVRHTWSGPQYPPRVGACREAPRSHHLPRSTPPARVSSAPVPPAPPQSREQPAASAPPSTRSASRASWRRCRRAALRRAAPSTERPATRQGRNGHARQARWT